MFLRFVGNDIVKRLCLWLGLDHRFGSALLGSGEGSGLHPGELTRRFLHGAIEEPEKSADHDDMDQGDDDERPAEAGF